MAAEALRSGDELRGRHPALNRCIGRSPAIRSVMRDLVRVADTRYPVLLEGESGTGKELVARILHEMSAGSAAPFEAVNCGAIPEPLLESELFGHVAGAFTGATRQHTGLFERAGSGTVFLDEIIEMSPSAQVKLLRVLQEGTFVPVGGEKTLRTRARVVAASNRDPRREIVEGRFRQDLYYRISVFPIRLPPLRHRLEDVPELVEAILRQEAKEMGMEPPSLRSEAMSRLLGYSFPGNVRELQNIVGALMIECRASRAIEERDVLAVFERHGLREPVAVPPASADGAVGAWVLEQLRLQRFNVAFAERILVARRKSAPDRGGVPVFSRSGLTYYLQGEAIRALGAASWDVDRASLWLAGSDDGVPRVRLKVRRFLSYAVKSLEDGGGSASDRLEALRQAFAKLPREYAPDLESLAAEYERGRWRTAPPGSRTRPGGREETA